MFAFFRRLFGRAPRKPETDTERLKRIVKEFIRRQRRDRDSLEPAYRVDGCQVVVGEARPLADNFKGSNEI